MTILLRCAFAGALLSAMIAGTPTASASHFVHGPVNGAPFEFYNVTAGDLDGDGDLDVMGTTNAQFLGGPSTVLVALNQGDGTFGFPEFFEIAATEIGEVALADLDLELPPADQLAQSHHQHARPAAYLCRQISSLFADRHRLTAPSVLQPRCHKDGQ